MKRTISVICAAALVMFAACQKEENAAQKVSLTASLEQQVDPSETKTALGPSNTVVWSEGDAIKVHTDAGLEKLTLVSGAGTTSASFGSTTGENPDYAIYPSSVNPSISGSTFTFTLPATQIYAENSFANGANVAVAKIDGGNMRFKNVCGVLKLQLKGSMKVKKIELTGKSSENLWGTFTVDANNVSNGATYVSDGGTTVTLDCSHNNETSENAGDGGVQLEFETATIFNIVVPVDAFAHGFETTVYDVNGDAYNTSVETTSDNTIERSTITKMPSKAVTLLPSDYTELSYIQTDGAAYIDTDLMLTGSEKWEMRFASLNGPLTASFAGSLNGGTTWQQNGNYSLTYHNIGYGIYCGTGVPVAAWQCGDFKDSRWHTWTWLGNPVVAPKLDNVGAWKGSTVEFCSLVSPSVPWRLFGRMTTAKGIGTVAQTGLAISKFVGPAWYFVSAKNSSGTIGLYNLADSHFYTNDGSGAFIAGPELTD